jgi:hypothetical protein
LEPSNINSRSFEILDEIHVDLSWLEIQALLVRIEENRWQLSKDFKLSVFKIASIEALCCHQAVVVRPEILAFIEGRMGLAAEISALVA